MTSTPRKNFAALALMCLLSASGAEANEQAGADPGSAGSDGIEGTWILTITPPFGGAQFLAFTSYIPGGVSISSPDRLPPVPGLGTVIGSAQGSWAPVGHRRFVSTHVEFRYGTVGEVVGTVKLRATTRLTSENTLEGQGQLVFCDAVLQHCSATGSALATVVGTRLRAEGPLP